MKNAGAVAFFSLILASLTQPMFSSDNIKCYDITASSRIVKKGKLFLIDSIFETHGLKSLSFKRLIYVCKESKIYPEKNILAAEYILLREGFCWSDEKNIHQVLIPSLAQLYIGLSRIVWDTGFYLRHLDGSPDDKDVLEKIRNKCPDPDYRVEKDKWSVIFYVMEGGVKEPSFEKYTFSGITVPFKISACTVETVCFEHKIMIRNPAPQ